MICNSSLIIFYLQSPMKDFKELQPEEGYLLVEEQEYKNIEATYSATYDFETVWENEEECTDDGSIACLYHFSRKPIENDMTQPLSN